MLNFFEQPWTLIGVSVLILFAVLTFRSVVPEKRRWWQWLLPVALVISAFGLDLLVATDLEKITSCIDSGLRAVEQEDYNTIENIIADNYRNQKHNNKESLLAHCRQRLPELMILKNKKRALLVEISQNDATAHLYIITTFDKNSFVSQNYKSFIMATIELRLHKQPDGKWLINRTEITELDKQPASWNDVR